MKRSFSLFVVILCALTLSVSDLAAQGLLKKLANAGNKALTSLTTKEHNGQATIAEVEIGKVSMKAFGSAVPGTRLDYLRAMRTGDEVTLYLAITNMNSSPLEVRMANYGDNSVYAQIGNTKIPASYISIGESASAEGVSNVVPVNSTLAIKLRFSGIPADVKQIPFISIGMSGHPELDASNKFFTFTLENVPVYNVGERAALDLRGPVKNVVISDASGEMIQGQYRFNINGQRTDDGVDKNEQRQYNSNGMLVSVINPEQGSEEKYFYNAQGNLVKKTASNEDFDSTVTYRYDQYDPYELIMSTTTSFGGNSNEQNRYGNYSIDAYGNWVQRAVLYNGTDTPVIEIRHIEYFDNE